MSINVMPNSQCYVRMGAKLQWTCYMITATHCKTRHYNNEWVKQSKTDKKCKNQTDTLLTNSRKQLTQILVIVITIICKC